MSAALPGACAMALKEWATVVEALARGEQLVLIRKGGLIERGGGFDLEAEAFLFYPTFEHQAVQYLRPQFRGYFEEAAARRAPPGKIRLDFAGVAVGCAQSRDPGVVARLEAFHVYNDAFLSQRLRWQPEQPLTIVTVRAYRLATPITVPADPRYAGCTSWVELSAPVPSGEAHPVLDEATFTAQRAAVARCLTS